jgi:hypothetical protein
MDATLSFWLKQRPWEATISNGRGDDYRHFAVNGKQQMGFNVLW